MPETKDPVAALSAPDIPTRAAGCRDLAAAGGPEHVSQLLAMATGDKSPGVRFGAAGAVADILSRHRLPPAFDVIPVATREAWLATVVSVDPGTNTGLFAVCGVLGVPGGIHRVFVGLRDPRQDVRAGACVGVWRAVASAAVNGDAALEARAVETLADARIRVESRVELARICADAGYLSAAANAEALVGQTIRQTQKLAAEIASRLAAPPSLLGLWVDRGVDATAVAPKAKGEALLAVLGEGDCILLSGSSVKREPLPVPARLLRVREAGEEAASPALQVGLRTWWPAATDDLCAFGDRLIAAGRFDLLEAADGVLGNSSAALRVRGAALLEQGQVESALLALEASVAGKRVPADAWWYLADALQRLGRSAEAGPHLERFLAKAAKKARFVDEARARLGV